jgi:hypothetical protein
MKSPPKATAKFAESPEESRFFERIMLRLTLGAKRGAGTRGVHGIPAHGSVFQDNASRYHGARFIR